MVELDERQWLTALSECLCVCDFRVIEAHPSLGHAAMLVAAAVNEEAVSGGGATGGSSSGVVT